MQLPKDAGPAIAVMQRLEQAGFKAYLVGGAVRDLLLGRIPQDWDVTTQALPEEVMGLFPRTVPTGLRHGTVTVLMGDGADVHRKTLESESAKLPQGPPVVTATGAGHPLATSVEVTTFRLEGAYSDHRHPDRVTFTGDVEADLARRDFTVNAMALDLRGALVDPWGGADDLGKRHLRAVGEARARFAEDPLRMLRGVRLAAELGLSLDPGTWHDLADMASLLAQVAVERIQEEFSRLLSAPRARMGVELLRGSGLLSAFLPELNDQFGFRQNRHHAYNVWEHTLSTLEGVDADLGLRLAAFFHDVAKPRTLSEDQRGRHFYGHDRLGAQMTEQILRRLTYPGGVVRRVATLVRYHMAFFPHPGLKDKTLRQMVGKVGRENISDLFALATADARAKGPGAEVSAAQREVMRRVEAILAEGQPLALADLAVDGRDLMESSGFPRGPWVGTILGELLELVLADPSKNERDVLLRVAGERLAKMKKRPRNKS